MQRLAAAFPLRADWLVLDVGGTPDIWALCPVRPRLVLLNTPRSAEGEPAAPGAAVVFGDGRRLPFADHSFDLAFTNSVIEHVGDEASQLQFANEIRRVGKRYWVQTPNRWFPVEQHLWTPFVHFLPRRLQRAIVPRFSVWRFVARAREDQRRYYLDHYLSTVRLLSARDLRRLFPDARVIRERLLGLSKSLVAARDPADRPSA
ncbi:MAG: methyltransferase domain-containing protein [Bryobacteraceae bacterium]